MANKQDLSPDIQSPSMLPEKKKRKPGKCPVRFEKEEGKNVLKALLATNYEVDNKKDINEQYDELLSKVTGTSDIDLACEIIDKGSMCIHGQDEANKKNVILQSLADQQPCDANEARLCAQATVLYGQAMKYLQRAEDALDDGIFDKQGWNQIFMRNATRLFDLHTKTIETLIRYKQKREQKIVVQHINLNDNSKAIVSVQMIAGGGGHDKN